MPEVLPAVRELAAAPVCSSVLSPAEAAGGPLEGPAAAAPVPPAVPPNPTSVTEETGTRPCPRLPLPVSHPSLSLGSLAHLDSESFCGVLSLLKLALQFQQCSCLLLGRSGEWSRAPV